MKVIYDLGKSKVSKSVIAIGVFDGVHRGHQLLIDRTVAEARKIKAKAVAITFFPHPAHVLSNKAPLPYLMSLEHRLTVLKDKGIDLVWVVPFNKSFAKIDPGHFIKDILVKKFSVKSIYVGENFRFGKNRSGDIALFKALSEQGGYQIHALKPIQHAGKIISSGRLRELIPQGKLSQAASLLGRPFSVLGEVVHGASRGRFIGFPTANIQYKCDVLPPLGVYAVCVKYQGNVLYGMANLGRRPTFKDKSPKLHLEVNLFNFRRNLYGKTILVEFLKKIRDEQAFPTPEALMAQIAKDEIKIRKFLIDQLKEE